MANIQIRSAVDADLETLYRFEQELIATERAWNPTFKDEPMHYYDLAAMIASADIQLLVAGIDGQLVACGYARIEAAKPYLRHAAHAYLGFMYVLAPYRGQGINIMIIDELCRWAVSRGISELRLDVYYDNASAIRAYEKAGFIRHQVHMRRPV